MRPQATGTLRNRHPHEAFRDPPWFLSRTTSREPEIGPAGPRTEKRNTDVDQGGELPDQRVPLSHAHLGHGDQHLQLHLLPPARLYGDTAGLSGTGLRDWPQRLASETGLRDSSQRLASETRLRDWPQRLASETGLRDSPQRLASETRLSGPFHTHLGAPPLSTPTWRPAPFHTHLAAPPLSTPTWRPAPFHTHLAPRPFPHPPGRTSTVAVAVLQRPRASVTRSWNR
ncbi:hypothetical protein EYF80_062577 [Liparis tanakae]|uniref:Uncharacterized protein n=1 Tax=Liparis tanakae TaxID=230148 RepID=A0A4Z2EEJ1_9TELE|nr:hypothetical protein EYF80_062577 [Liparis tanakae]